LGQPLQRTPVSDLPVTPFDTIESAQDYIDLLLEAIEETRRDVGGDLRLSAGPGGERRTDALQLVALNLNKLSSHVTKSRRILNDLRTLRRLLLEERKTLADTEAHAKVAGAV
jgi:hypothetical protein